MANRDPNNLAALQARMHVSLRMSPKKVLRTIGATLGGCVVL